MELFPGIQNIPCNNQPLGVTTTRDSFTCSAWELHAFSLAEYVRGDLRLREPFREGRNAYRPRPHELAIGETVILLHPPLPLVGVSVGRCEDRGGRYMLTCSTPPVLAGVALHDNHVPKGAPTFHVLHEISHYTPAAHIGM